MLAAQLADVGLFGSVPRFGDLSIHAAIDLRRSFSRAELERAAEAAVRAFPILGRRYEARFWRDRWTEVEGPVSDVVHVDDDPGDVEAATRAWVDRPLVLTRERPFRLVALRRGQGSRLIFSISHLAVDGAGVAAVGHVLGASLYGAAPSLPVDPRRELGRTLERVRWRHAPVLLRDIAATVLQPVRVRRAAKRARPFPADASGTSASRHLRFSSAEIARARARCGVSVNDLLVAALARVSARRTGDGGDVVVLYTMDLRRYASSPRLTAANTSAIMTVVVPRGAAGDLSRAASAVAEITARHRRGLAGPAFVLSPTLLALGAPHELVRRWVPRLHPLLVDLALDRGLFVTNVGKIDHGLAAFGDDIEDLHVLGPSVRGISIPAVVAFGFRGRLHVELLSGPGLSARALDQLEAELYEALELPAVGDAPSAAVNVAGAST